MQTCLRRWTEDALSNPVVGHFWFHHYVRPHVPQLQGDLLRLCLQPLEISSKTGGMLDLDCELQNCFCRPVIHAARNFLCNSVM